MGGLIRTGARVGTDKVLELWLTIGMVAILLKMWLTIGMVAILLEWWLYY